jgi:hypothetical protein
VNLANANALNLVHLKSAVFPTRSWPVPVFLLPAHSGKAFTVLPGNRPQFVSGTRFVPRNHRSGFKTSDQQESRSPARFYILIEYVNVFAKSRPMEKAQSAAGGHLSWDFRTASKHRKA